MKLRAKQYFTDSLVLLIEPATGEINRKSSISFPNRGYKMENSYEIFVIENH